MSSGTTAIGGEVDENDHYIAPTVLKDCRQSDPAMKEEVSLYKYFNVALNTFSNSR